MNPQLLILFAAVGLVLSATGVGRAQAEKESEHGLSHILRLGGIDRELELTPEQHDQLFGLWLEIKYDLQKAFQNYKDNFSNTLPARNQAELQKELAEAISKIREKEFERLEKTLLSGQLDRLKQLRIQYLNRKTGGIGALQEELNLTSAQIRKIEQASVSLKKQLLDIQSRQREEQLTKVEIVKIVKDLRDESRKQVMRVLTDAQKRKLKMLQGEEFDFATGQLVNRQANNTEAKDADNAPDAGKGQAATPDKNGGDK